MFRKTTPVELTVEQAAAKKQKRDQIKSYAIGITALLVYSAAVAAVAELAVVAVDKAFNKDTDEDQTEEA